MNDLEERYRAWLAKNPLVMQHYRRFAMELLACGRRFSVKLLTERIRWEQHLAADKDADGFKINNNYSAYIARDLIKDMPELADILELRTVREDALTLF